MKWELHFVYEDDELVSAYRMFSDESVEDVDKEEIEVLRKILKEIYES